MTRRNFVQAGLSGAALLMAQRDSRAQLWNTDPGVTVVGVDGAGLTTKYLEDYLEVGADVWQYSENTIDFDRFASIQGFVDANSSKVTLAKSYSDILAAKRAGKVALVVGAQDMWPLEWQWKWSWPANAGPNNYVAGPPVTGLAEYYDLGLRIGNLAYQLSDSFGGGLLDPSTPLSVTGKYMVDQMQEMGILVDCTHSGVQTTLDILKRSKRPVVFSHSSLIALNDNMRNVTNQQIEGVAKTGGLIGVCPVNAYLKWTTADAPHANDPAYFPPLASISEYVDVMDYIKDNWGVDYIGIGTDWTQGDPPDTSGLKLPPQSFALPTTILYRSDTLEYVQNFNQVKNLPVLRAELVRHGYSAADIAKVLGGNWMRVFRNAWNS